MMQLHRAGSRVKGKRDIRCMGKFSVYSPANGEEQRRGEREDQETRDQRTEGGVREYKRQAHCTRKLQRGAATKSGIPAGFDLATSKTSQGRYAWEVRRANLLRAVQRLFFIIPNMDLMIKWMNGNSQRGYR